MKKLLLLTILFFATTAYGQVTFSQEEANRIEASLIELKASRQTILALTAENAAKDVVIAKKDAVIVAKDAIIEQQNERDKLRIKELEEVKAIKCSEVKVLLFVIKWKRCGK